MKFLMYLLVCCVVLMLGICPAMAESMSPAVATVQEPLTWAYLGTIAGAAAFTMIVVQFVKVPLDRIWKIPTRLLVYVIALCTMLVATAFTAGLTVENSLLVACNAFLASMTAFGAYELTFAKADREKNV